MVDYLRNLFKGVPQVTTLTGGVFDNGGNSLCLFQSDIYGVRYYPETFINIYLSQVAAGMEVEPVQTKLFAALHLVQKGLSRFIETFIFGMSQINQVAVVG